MRFLAALMVLALLAVTGFAQPTGGAPQHGQQQMPNLWQMLLYRNMFDMNWLNALVFSNGLGGMGGGAGGGIMPWFLLGNM